MSGKTKAIIWIIIIIVMYSGKASPHFIEGSWIVGFICLFIPAPEKKKSIRDEKIGDVLDDLLNRKH